MRFDLVQCLRAMAAVAVVLFHSAGATLKYSPSPAWSYPLWHTYGGFGVNLFFVISGFVIFYSGRGLSAREFATRRLKRIVPIYWILTLAAAAFALFGLSAGMVFTVDRLAASLGFVSFARSETPLLYVGWTLEFELYFYAVVALALLVLRNPWPIAVGFLCSMIALGAALEPTHPVAFFATKPVMLEFVAGVLIGQAAVRKIGRTEVVSFVLAAMAVSVSASPALFLPLIVSAALVAAAVRWNRSAPKWANLLGDASYSIYLVQVFTVPLVAKAMKAVMPAHHPELLVLVAATATTVAGVASYMLIERPIGRMLSRRHAEIPTEAKTA